VIGKDNYKLHLVQLYALRSTSDSLYVSSLCSVGLSVTVTNVHYSVRLPARSDDVSCSYIIPRPQPVTVGRIVL